MPLLPKERTPLKWSIEAFTGEYRWLSNFYVDPQDGFCVEKHYQAQKHVRPEDRRPFGREVTPSQAKRMGKRIPLRPDWDSVKCEIMLQLLRRKFSSPVLASWLKDTGDAELVEGNYWGDTYWGVCRGVGLNMLGKLLMQVRKELNDLAA